jgi:predicted lipase
MKEIGITWRQALRAMANCFHDEKRDGKEDYSFFAKSTVTTFASGIDEGYTAESLDGKSIFLVFCGTNRAPIAWIDWVTNFDTTFEGSDPLIKAHRGFFNGYMTCRFISDFARDYKDVYCLGHSRGGAIATLCSRDVRWKANHTWQQKSKNVWLITAGSPAVYNKAGAEDFDTCGIATVRFVYRSDPVPDMPPAWMGYQHVKGLFQMGTRGLFPNPLDHIPGRYINGDIV